MSTKLLERHTGDKGDKGDKGDTGDKGDAGNNGSDGYNSLVSTESEAEGDNCQAGGLRISVGLDLDRNGVLDASEITQVAFLCTPTTPLPAPDGDIDTTFGSSGRTDVGSGESVGADFLTMASNGDILAGTRAASGGSYHYLSRFTADGVEISRQSRNKGSWSHFSGIAESAEAGFVFSIDYTGAAILRKLGSSSSNDTNLVSIPSALTGAYDSNQNRINQIFFVNNEQVPTVLGTADYNVHHAHVLLKYFLHGNNWNHVFHNDPVVKTAVAARNHVVYCAENIDHTEFRIRKLSKGSGGVIAESTLLSTDALLAKFQTNPGELYCFDTVAATEHHESYILVGGYDSARLIIALNAAGEVDSSFGVDGVLVSSEISGRFDRLEVQADGKLLVARSGGFEGTIKRLNRNGTIDSSFGSAGKVDVFGLRDIVLTSDQKIIFSTSSEIGRIK